MGEANCLNQRPLLIGSAVFLQAVFGVTRIRHMTIGMIK